MAGQPPEPCWVTNWSSNSIWKASRSPCPGRGRVDILARQATTVATVVIENQLGMSDESHFSRLLGYAANREAGILVWVARGFTDYYCSILRWLNASDTIDVYAVEVRAYRVGNSLAANFRTVVEPPQAQAGTSAPPRETASTHYAEFYRPLVTQLRRSGMQAVGKGGWRGRWRSFQTGYPHTVYATGLDEGESAGLPESIWTRPRTDPPQPGSAPGRDTIQAEQQRHLGARRGFILGHARDGSRVQRSGG